MAKHVPATEFKQTCLRLLDTVGPEGIVITKHGKPVAKLIPIPHTSARERRWPVRVGGGP
ncbi:MAG: type II toxin-antitoxin system Phd/YefM family antitoxin [Acidobacteria bacterium]|nr:MAG: type II toxin-antitoxin system Phd/YefM family antitoxin [Acidobacteriota bacterium]REK01033.1 MAG: type II toxin-antitoxin system Phd/YefM family antitoxin [Acidobacteriota bacterium]